MLLKNDENPVVGPNLCWPSVQECDVVDVSFTISSFVVRNGYLENVPL